KGSGGGARARARKSQQEPPSPLEGRGDGGEGCAELAGSPLPAPAPAGAVPRASEALGDERHAQRAAVAAEDAELAAVLIGVAMIPMGQGEGTRVDKIEHAQRGAVAQRLFRRAGIVAHFGRVD